VHARLGPGLHESAYEHCPCHEFDQRAIASKHQVDITRDHDGRMLDCGYQADLIVHNEVILALKSVAHILPLHMAQFLTYLRPSNCHIGLPFNFNTLCPTLASSLGSSPV